MSFEVEEIQGFTVVRLVGEIDLRNSPQARKQILTQLKKKKDVMVDLSGVEYIDSSGIASLVEGFQYARNNGREFGLLGVSAFAMNVLRLARLDKVFRIYDSLEDRIAHGT